MRPATADELARWDDLIAANPDGGNVLQLKAFAETKAAQGWRPQYLMMGEGSDTVAILALERHIPLLGRFWYVPKGPGIVNPDQLKAFVAAIRSLPNPPFAIRLDPEVTALQIKAADITKLGLVKAPRDIQYNVNTVIIDLKPSEEDILNSFKQKTRYNVRLATKKGVTAQAVETTDANIDTMYQLYATTTKRAGVYLRSKSYFADFWHHHATSGHGQLFFASYHGQVLAGAFVTYIGHKALYKDGGSVREHTEVQAPYELQWQIMLWLKKHGITEYDLHGSPPAHRIDDRTHPLAGLARFKTGFNQNVTEYVGTYDLPLDNAKYHCWIKLGERLATTYEFRVKRQLFY